MASDTKKDVSNVTIKHEGAQIILPLVQGKPMSYKTAIQWMERKQQEDETEIGIHYAFDCSPLDGAVALKKAIAHKYGWTQLVPTPGFFSDTPPVMIGVPVSATETEQTPYGRITMPGINGYLSTEIKPNPVPTFVLSGVVRKKNEKDVAELYELTKKFLRESSIYKGKAIKIDFSWMEDGVRFDPIEHAPKFMDLQGVKDDDLIFGNKVMAALDVGLFTPIEQAEACRRYGVPLKRGVLLYGPYGTGKTMTANVAALKAARNGWTFIYLESVSDLKAGLEFAQRYAPAVVFAEDIDRVMEGDRSLDMDDMLNIMDGVDTKGAEIITVFTTNHIEQINPAALRMGRLDTLVEVTPPDATAVKRLVSLYARGLLQAGADLEKIGRALEGKIPAFIREVTERAKIAAIGRMNGGDITGKVLEEDLLSAANAMEPHHALLEPRESGNRLVKLRDLSVALSGEPNVRIAAGSNR